MSNEIQLTVLIILTILDGGMIYIWIKELRNMEKQKNSFWSDDSDDDKPYTSIKEWVDEIRYLIWPSITLIILIIIAIILLTTVTN